MSTTPFPLPITLTPADRKALRARAHHLDPVVMIGEAGLTRAVLAEADRALDAHELIKIRVLGDDRAQRQALLTEICSALGCAAVQSIGKLLIVYRPKPIEDVGERKRPRGPHLPKKLAATGATTRRKPQKARKPMKAMKVDKAAPAAKPAKAGASRKAAAAKKPARGAAGKPEPLGTKGKRTALGAHARASARHGAAGAATQGPAHISGRSAQGAREGSRPRAKKA